MARLPNLAPTPSLGNRVHSAMPARPGEGGFRARDILERAFLNDQSKKRTLQLMGRKRTFDEAEVVARSASAFIATGYGGTSIDDLVNVTGLHRGSIYQTFGSKRKLFLSCLQRATNGPGLLDLVLVALLELAPGDDEVRDLVLTKLPGQAAAVLGSRLLERAHIDTTRGEML
jgi:TetR/AcrR family transcriptional repressor of nem operon